MRHHQGSHQQDPAMPRLPRITQTESGKLPTFGDHPVCVRPSQASGPAVPRETPWNRPRNKNLYVVVLILPNDQQWTNHPPEHFPVKIWEPRDPRNIFEIPRATARANP